MIPDIFAKVLSMSISAGWLIIGIIVLRLILHRRSKWIFPVFWCLAGLRLIVPCSLEVETSLLPVSNYIDTAASAASSGRAGEMFFILSLIWCVGVAVMHLSAIVRYLRLRSKLKTAVLLSDNVYQTECVPCPFITGILHPRIYAPFHIGDDTLAQAIAHEKAHIRRHDHWLKLAAYLVLAIHWFNPLVWAAYILLGRDIEYACDESIIESMDASQKAAYAQSILSCTANRHSFASGMLAFGGSNVENRIKHILNCRKTPAALAAAAFLAVAAIAVCIFVAPQKTEQPAEPDAYILTPDGQTVPLDLWKKQVEAATLEKEERLIAQGIISQEDMEMLRFVSRSLSRMLNELNDDLAEGELAFGTMQPDAGSTP